MPITQDRMIALLNAACDYQLAWESAQELITRTGALVDSKKITEVTALEQIRLMINEIAMMRKPKISFATIAWEKRHFSQKYLANQNNARREAIRRGSSGKPKRQRVGLSRALEEILPPGTSQTAPNTLAPSLRMQGNLYNSLDSLVEENERLIAQEHHTLDPNDPVDQVISRIQQKSAPAPAAPAPTSSPRPRTAKEIEAEVAESEGLSPGQGPTELRQG